VSSNQIAKGFEFCFLIGSHSQRCYNQKLQELGMGTRLAKFCVKIIIIAHSSITRGKSPDPRLYSLAPCAIHAIIHAIHAGVC